MPGSLLGAVSVEDGLARGVIRHLFVNAHVQIIARLVGEEDADRLTLPIRSAGCVRWSFMHYRQKISRSYGLIWVI